MRRGSDREFAAARRRSLAMFHRATRRRSPAMRALVRPLDIGSALHTSKPDPDRVLAHTAFRCVYELPFSGPGAPESGHRNPFKNAMKTGQIKYCWRVSGLVGSSLLGAVVGCTDVDQSG